MSNLCTEPGPCFLLSEGIPLFHSIDGVMELELLHQKSYSTGVL